MSYYKAVVKKAKSLIKGLSLYSLGTDFKQRLSISALVCAAISSLLLSHLCLATDSISLQPCMWTWFVITNVSNALGWGLSLAASLNLPCFLAGTPAQLTWGSPVAPVPQQKDSLHLTLTVLIHFTKVLTLLFVSYVIVCSWKKKKKIKKMHFTSILSFSFQLSLR